MSDRLLRVDDDVHELKFGTSFDSKSSVAFHSIKYDFKPASVDASRESLVEVGEGHQVTVNVPHVEGAGTTHTVYKGNKRETPKECILIIDHKTGTFTLEKLSNNIMLKKTRLQGSSKVHSAQGGNRPSTPVEVNKQKMSPVAKQHARSTPTPSQKSPVNNSPPITPVPVENIVNNSLIGEISSSDSSGSDNDSSDDSDVEDDKMKTSNTSSVPQNVPKPDPPKPAAPKSSYKILDMDLCLSDSDSDSD